MFGLVRVTVRRAIAWIKENGFEPMPPRHELAGAVDLSRWCVAHDFDDNLFYSERVALGAAWTLTKKVHNSKGLPFEMEVEAFIKRFPGKTYRKILEDVCAETGLVLTNDEVDVLVAEEQTGAIYALSIHGEPTLGALDMLRNSKQRRIRSVIASSSALQRLEVCIKRALFHDYFSRDQIYSVQTLGLKSKPAPDVYNRVREVLAPDPRRFIATEDSLSGVRSAVAAGVRVVGYVGALSKEDRPERRQLLMNAGAHMVIDHWDEFIPILEKLERQFLFEDHEVARVLGRV